MKSKTFIILVVVCCILGGIAYLTMNQEYAPENEQDRKMGDSLLPDLSLENVATVSLKDHEDSVTLEKGADVWGIKERFGYPADFSKLSDIVEKVKDAKIGRTFKAEGKALSRLTLHSPDKADVPEEERGARIVLKDEENKALADIIVGKTRDASAGAGGHYVMLANDHPFVHLVDKSFRFLDIKPEQWLDKKLLDIKPEDVEKVVCMDNAQNPIYTLKRPEKGKDPEFADLPDGKKIKSDKVKDVFKVLSYLRMEDVADPAKEADKTGLDKAVCFEYHLFDGMIYRAYPGNAVEDDKEKFYFKADVSYIAPEIKKEEKEGDEGQEEAKAKIREEEARQAEQSAEAVKLNEKISPWTYLISKWKHDNLIADVGELLEEAETDAQDQQPQAEGNKMVPQAMKSETEDQAEPKAAPEMGESEAVGTQEHGEKPEVKKTPTAEPENQKIETSETPDIGKASEADEASEISDAEDQKPKKASETQKSEPDNQNAGDSE